MIHKSSRRKTDDNIQGNPPIRPSADFKQKPCKQKGMAGYIQNMKEKLPTKKSVLDNVIQI